MKTISTVKIIGISMLLIAGLVACDKPGPAETAGKKIDTTADEAGKKIGEGFNKAGNTINQQEAKAGVAIKDTEITTKVKAAIFAEPGLKTLQISVDTINGVVNLTGSVDSQARSDLAKGLASSVAGVKTVDNRLSVNSIK